MTQRQARLSSKQVEDLLLDTEPWLSCDQCFDLMDAHVEAVASGHSEDTVPGLGNHLQGCPACAEEVASLLALIRDQRASTKQD